MSLARDGSVSIFMTQNVALCPVLALIISLASLRSLVCLLADTSPPAVPLSGRSQSVNSGHVALYLCSDRILVHDIV